MHLTNTFGGVFMTSVIYVEVFDKDNTNHTIYPIDSCIVYQYMLFFHETFN